MDWISVSITYLAKNPLPIFTDNDDITSVNVYTYISCVDIVFEAVSQLHRIFVSEKSLPFEKESTIFADNFSCKDDDFFNASSVFLFKSKENIQVTCSFSFKGFSNSN